MEWVKGLGHAHVRTTLQQVVRQVRFLGLLSQVRGRQARVAGVGDNGLSIRHTECSREGKELQKLKLSYNSTNLGMRKLSQGPCKSFSASQASTADPYVIDSHIHLYPGTHFTTLNWAGDLPVDHRLSRQYSVDEFRTAIDTPIVKGFVFIEADRKSGLEPQNWGHALDEVSLMARIKKGRPIKFEGHKESDQELLLGFIAWAPMASGVKVVKEFVNQAFRRCKDLDVNPKVVKGFRYLLQDKAPGTMLQPNFLQVLSWLAEVGYTFDLGVDARSGGLHQLAEACEMLELVYHDEKSSNLKIIINHFCKPNLHLSVSETQNGHTEFVDWKKYVEKMGTYPLTYMKLSGFLSELVQQEEELGPMPVEDLVLHTKPWVDVVFKAFGPSRIMFGSDWPVCNAGGPSIEQTWRFWYSFVDLVLESQNLSKEEKVQIWSGTVAEAYNIHDERLIEQKSAI